MPMFRRRRNDDRAGLPDRWRELLDAHSVQWRLLDDAERQRLGELADWLLRNRRWEAARGFELTDEVRTVVSAHAALLVLGLDETWFDAIGAVVVREGAMEEPGARQRGGRGIVTRTPGVIDGEAHHGDGPLMVAWDAVRREARQLRWGRDVVLHEFAHKLDMADGTLDGTPRLDDPEQLATWVRVCTNHFERVREGTGVAVLRQYAGTNVGEFFAVATETFFTRPLDLLAQAGDLYAICEGFYRQDTAGRLRRAVERGALAPPSPPRIIVRRGA